MKLPLTFLKVVALVSVLAIDSCSCCFNPITAVKGAYTKVKDTFTSVKKKVTPEKPKYIGCYADRDDSRDIQFIGRRSSDMTIGMCNSLCAEEYPLTRFFGVQNGNLCFCGNDYGKHGVKLDGHCDKPCAGSKDDTCGGELLNSVYEIKH